MKSPALIFALFLGLNFTGVARAEETDPRLTDEEYEPGGAHAGEAPEHEDLNKIELIAGFVNFALLMGVLVWKGKAPLSEFLKDRKRGVADALSEAQRMKAEAEAKYAEYQARLANLDKELAEIRENILQTGATDLTRTVEEADKKADRMRRDTEFVIEQQIKQLRADLRQEIVEAAIAAAEKTLRTHASVDDQQRIAKDFMNKLSGGETHPHGHHHHSPAHAHHASTATAPKEGSAS